MHRPERDRVETDYLKFFQSFIASMVEIGGINLPRSVSSKLGRNLGEIYKQRGVTDPETALTSMFKAMGGEKVIFERHATGFSITTRYPTDFCPIGGALKPKRHEMFIESICYPYARGFLSAFEPQARIDIQCKDCVLRSGDNCCKMVVDIGERGQKHPPA